MGKINGSREQADRGRKRPPAAALAGIFLVIAAAVWLVFLYRQEEKEVLEYRRIAELSGHPGGMAFSVLKDAAEKFPLETGAGREEAPFAGKGEGQGMAYDWDALEAVNQDVIGWLCLPGLVDLPVAGASDNQFYLSHDFSGKRSRFGCLFMDRDTGEEDFNRVIYGHNMGTGSEAMFSVLIKYEEREYFEENRVLFYAGRYEEAAAYEVFAVAEYNVKDVEEWDFRERNHEGRKERLAWMEELKGRALFYREPEKLPDGLIILATCDRRTYGKDGRFLVVAGR